MLVRISSTALLGLAVCACGSGDEPALLPAGEVRGAPIVDAEAERERAPAPASGAAEDASAAGAPEAADAAEAAETAGATAAAAPAEPPVPPGNGGGASADPGSAAAEDESEDYRIIDWELISGFDYAMLEPKTLLAVDDGDPLPELEDRFPTEVVELDGERVLLEGYMIPYEYDDRGIYSFTLVRDQAQCCFGASPRMNHWISVEMADDGRADPADLDPIYVKGRFEVGEEIEDGYVTSVYRIVADEVDFGF